MKRVVILCHEHDNLQSVRYYITAIAAELRAHDVDVVLQQGLDGAVTAIAGADVVVQHCHLTKLPDAYRLAGGLGLNVVNRNLLDTSKRVTSRLLVQWGDDYGGPVIVKSNHNAGGAVEAALARRGLWRTDHARDVSQYQIFETPTLVPEALWLDELRVVERYLPELVPGDRVPDVCRLWRQPVQERVYALRLYKFLGAAESNELCLSMRPIVKGSNVFHREDAGPVPDELRALRRALGCDFGKIDYGIVGGAVVVYDVNRTPTMTLPPAAEVHRVQAFAQALATFQERAP